MAWRGAASRSIIAAVRARAASPSSTAASRLRSTAPLPAPSRLRSTAPLPAPSRRSVPAFAFATARPLAAMSGSPAAAVVKLTGHAATSVRACCELSQGT
uniref:Uncharacterized protein n=1 Tax=Zea mays TaxID=4577 RepID=B6U9Z4_MAIZE|nr:hypothetical protein [Zea mays]